MRKMAWGLVLAVALVVSVASSLLSCKADSTRLVVGIQSEPMGGIVSALHIVVKVAGAVVTDETVTPPHGSRVGFPQPWEKVISGKGKGTAKVEVEVEAMGGPGLSAPLITRHASTQFVPDKVALLRVQLESRCVVYPPPPPGSKIPGPLSGPTCSSGTCIRGLCQVPYVPPAALESYAPNWPSNAPDRCKPRGGGAPTLQTGTGQSYYLPLTPGQTLQAEAGPQGGHHIWMSVRMKNMKQAGSTTKIVGVQPGTGTQVQPSTFAFTFDPDEGGFCKLSGLRYQLDTGGIDYTQFLGKPLDVTITVADPSGATASSTAHINIAPTLINP
jgi:hypothetical protein